MVDFVVPADYGMNENQYKRQVVRPCLRTVKAVELVDDGDTNTLKKLEERWTLAVT